MKAPVSIWILAARTDLPYMLQTIPHLMRACNYPFTERVLAIDSAPLTGDKLRRYATGSQEELKSACQKLVDLKVIDRIAEIDYDPALIKKVYQKYFGTEQAKLMLNHTHNWKGSTIYASLYCIEASASDYYLHFDADMLLHQDQGNDWISEAIELMESIPTIVATRPLCGPPHPEGKVLYSRPAEDPRGFYPHNSFSMRAYLVNKQRFPELSPIPLMWKYYPLLSRYLPSPLQSVFASVERKLRRQVKPIKGALESFEVTSSQRLEETSFVRADLSSTKAWTIHPPDHGPEFIKALPQLISLIEQGKFPLDQAGFYDLLLNEWSDLLNISISE
ncbi:MAG: hypothetical protein F6K36_07000 [Symploca sp. SIO3C6]|uniref:Glycosyltransferase family 2 protein n=1 Tax=Symploca sp. SIO1C4 TaxID=2607765 RepID=A0A6B3N295_9CYAN|nr:hypothetical protein [Symploca sp. SIO3C6]NER27279.1 hypothetical protein [Symploca sp. SIO1C4]NET05478.1 hypothetical protein [Symploca sp. SIO2B6]